MLVACSHSVSPENCSDVSFLDLLWFYLSQLSLATPAVLRSLSESPGFSTEDERLRSEESHGYANAGQGSAIGECLFSSMP